MKKAIAGIFLTLFFGALILIFTTMEDSCGEDRGISTTTNEEASEENNIVGGPCSYDSHAGNCHIDEVRDGSPALFTFTGTVSGKDVTLKGNEAEGDYKTGDDIACSIQFITKGTCTPCGFDLNGAWGSCGSEAWEFFRSLEE